MTENENEIEDSDKYSEPLFPSVDQIEVKHVKNLSYNEFFDSFMVKNLPVLINGIADQWDCMNWIADSTNKSSESCINFDYLAKKIENTQNVPIANCNKVYFNSHEKSEMPFIEFLNYWRKQYDEQDEFTAKDLLYLKDWHLRRSQPDYHFYTTPIYFASDWLNEYCEEKNCDDYRFVYMGPKGTWTPFHADVFSSFSWSTNIVGTKRWIFFPPHEEDKLRDRFGNLPFDIGDEQIKSKIHEKEIKSFEIIQSAGQTVFVPSGWHHQVWNLEDTISVNHNWFNGCNIHWIWTAIYKEFNDVLREIDDCKDMDNFDEHCQLMLKSDFGLDFKMFLEILQCIVANRLKILQEDRNVILNERILGRKHAIFDLQSICRVLNEINKICNIEELKQITQDMIHQINSIVKQ